MNQQNQQNNKRIAKNTLALYVRMIVIMAINFYMARVVLDVLGVDDYGIYNLVSTVVVVFSFLKSSLSEATQRFINYAMGSGKSNLLRPIFSTCIICYFALIVCVCLGGSIFWQFWGNTLNLPTERFETATYVFYIGLLAFSANLIHVPFNAAIIAEEEMGIFAKISILEVVVKLALTYLLELSIYDKLRTYSVLMAINAILISVIYIIYCYRHFEYTIFKPVWRNDLFRRILSFTSWNMLGSLAGVLSESGVGLIFNSFCGVVLNASIGLANQVNGALSGFITGYQTAFKPQIVKTYAACQYNEYTQLICRSSKFSFFLFFLVSVPVIVNMDYLLHLWLTVVPDYACIFCQIILIGSLIDATSGVFYSSIGATGKIRFYQIAVTCVFLLHVIVTLLLLETGADYSCVFFSRLLTRGVLNFCIGIFFLQRLTSFRFLQYYIETIIPIFWSAFLPLVCIYLFVKLFGNDHLLTVIINVTCFELLSLVLIYRFGLKTTERQKISAFILERVRK